MSFFKNLFNKKDQNSAVSEKELAEQQEAKNYEQKVAALEQVLGKMHDTVGHSIIPFALGGSVDMYYFLYHIPGTGFATMELLDANGTGPQPNKLGTYELVAFAKQPYNKSEEKGTLFDLMEERIYRILTNIGNYSFKAVLNPNDTCEIPGDDTEESKYLIFDEYRPGEKKFKIGEKDHHLLLCMEVFKNEMEFARAKGGSVLIEKLKMAGYYPYSDLDRLPVV